MQRQTSGGGALRDLISTRLTFPCRILKTAALQQYQDEGILIQLQPTKCLVCNLLYPFGHGFYTSTCETSMLQAILTISVMEKAGLLFLE